MKVKTYEDNPDGHISQCYVSRSKPRVGGYFIGGSGIFWHFGKMRNFIHKRRKDLLDKPALVQIREIGLGDDFAEGVTPTQLPRTLAAKERGWFI